MKEAERKKQFQEQQRIIEDEESAEAEQQKLMELIQIKKQKEQDL